jgi:hypothetical protein
MSLSTTDTAVCAPSKDNFLLFIDQVIITVGVGGGTLDTPFQRDRRVHVRGLLLSRDRLRPVQQGRKSIRRSSVSFHLGCIRDVPEKRKRKGGKLARFFPPKRPDALPLCAWQTVRPTLETYCEGGSLKIRQGATIQGAIVNHAAVEAYGKNATDKRLVVAINKIVYRGIGTGQRQGSNFAK